MQYKSVCSFITVVTLLAACAGKPSLVDVDRQDDKKADLPETPLVNLPPPNTTVPLDPTSPVDTTPELGQLELTVHFDLNKDTIKPEDAQRLAALAKKLEGQPHLFKQKKLTIQGHTDVRGTDAINDALSGRRASAVLNLLRRQSAFLQNQIIEPIGQGSHHLLKEGNTEADHAENRRAEVRWTPTIAQ